MSAPFEALEDRLLRGGIAPRHVRRYLRELSEHLADLTQTQAEASHDGETAASRARARLGSDAELADAMLRRRDFRSISARFPWLVFGVLPPLAAIAGLVLLVAAVQLAGIKGGAYIPRQGILFPAPAWFVWTTSGLVFTVNFLIVPLLGTLLAWTAQRQRMALLWPLLGMALILMLGVHGTFHIDAEGRIFRRFGTILSLPGLFGHDGIDWPTFWTQAALLCLPMAWLLHRRALAKVPVSS